MNTFDKFLATAKTFSISELDKYHLFLNFCSLNNKYSELLKYNDDTDPKSVDIKLYYDIKASEENKNIIEFKDYLFISMTDENANKITDSMDLKERIGFINFTQDYIKLNMAREEKKKSL